MIYPWLVLRFFSTRRSHSEHWEKFLVINISGFKSSKQIYTCFYLIGKSSEQHTQGTVKTKLTISGSLDKTVSKEKLFKERSFESWRRRHRFESKLFKLENGSEKFI